MSLLAPTAPAPAATPVSVPMTVPMTNVMPGGGLLPIPTPSPVQNQLNLPVVNRVSASVEQSPSVAAQPPLMGNVDPSKINEIRRTVYVGNLNSQTTTAEQLLEFFKQVGDVKFVRMAGDETQPTRFAFVEFVDQESVSRALAFNGVMFGDRPLKINHSNNAIVKPPELTPQAAAKELESVMKRVREAQSTIAAAIEPAEEKHRSSSRTRRPRHSRSRSKTHRKRSRSRQRRKPSPSVRTAHSHDPRGGHRRRSRSRDKRRSRSRGHRRKSRGRSRSPARKVRSPSPKKGKKDKRRERSRDRKQRSTSRKRSHKDQDKSRKDKTLKVQRDYEREEKEDAESDGPRSAAAGEETEVPRSRHNGSCRTPAEDQVSTGVAKQMLR